MLKSIEKISQCIIKESGDNDFSSILDALDRMKGDEELRIRIAKFKPKKITLKVMKKNCTNCKSFNPDMGACGFNCPVDSCDGCPIDDDDENMAIYCPLVDETNTCGRWEAKDAS